MLKNRTVRIVYRRQGSEGSTKAINSEHSRRKTFRNFGATCATQIFYNVITDDNDNKVTDPADSGRLVFDWFTTGKLKSLTRTCN
jgi:hypothetical protein